MDMKKERRKIYLRCFALLLALWLALMSIFSWRILQDARAKSYRQFLGTAQAFQQEFVNAWRASDGTLEENSWQRIVSSVEAGGFTASLFTYEGDPVWTPKDPASWTVTLGKNRFQEEAAAVIDPARWFDLDAVSREMDKLKFPRQAELILEDVLLTPDREAVPRTMLLRYNYETVAEFTNNSFGEYEGELYPECWVDFPVDALEAVTAATQREDILKMQSIAAASTASQIEMRLDDPISYDMANYTIKRASTCSWDALDRTFVTVIGFGRVVEDTWRAGPDSLETSNPRPTYWLMLAGRSDVWGNEGAYWLCCVLISLTGFLAAAWLLAHMTWKGQKARLLYERRTRETANAIAHNLKTPLSVLHASAENLEANVRPEKQADYIAEIVRQTETMDQALLDLLDLAAGQTNA